MKGEIPLKGVMGFYCKLALLEEIQILVRSSWIFKKKITHSGQLMRGELYPIVKSAVIN